ncbi:MAG: insulinase family protein [Chlamydiales bacterium]|nr:insulinase family protein [Chlamydiales bacterium]
MIKKLIFTLFSLSFILSSQLLNANEAEQKYRVIEDERSIEVLTPDFKAIKSKKISLKNGLQALIISDPKIDKSGAGLNVAVGSWEDPKEHPGMAHFCEHMLFLGTKKYPHEREFSQFIDENGGMQNAATSVEKTFYMFSIKHSEFEEALDRFSHFFIDPLFNPSGVDREKTAIHNEFAKDYENEGWRSYSVASYIANPNHPHHRFKTGNLDSLKNTTPEELRKWYEKHYSSEKMRLVIISSMPLEQLTEMVAEKFSLVPRRFTPEKELPKNLLSREYTRKVIHSEPIRDTRELSLFWEMPSNFANQLELSPGKVVGYIIGHEGQSSLLSQLKKEGLAESLSAGEHILGKQFPLFYINIALTKKGLENHKEVITRCFQAINYFKAKPTPVHILKEIQKMDTLDYQYQQRANVFEQMMTLSRSLHDEPMSTFPQKTNVLHKINPKVSQSYFKHLDIRNFYCMLTAKDLDVEYTEKTPYFNVPVAMKDFDLAFIEELERASPHAHIAFPDSNPFIPEKLELLAYSPEKLSSLLPQPKVIHTSEQGKFYHLRDKIFLTPEAIVNFELRSKYLDQGGIKEAVAAQLFNKFVIEGLSEFSYTTHLAGITPLFSIKDNHSFSLTISGYSEQLDTTLKHYLKHLRSIELDEEKFLEYKQALELDYQNQILSNPTSQAAEELKHVIYERFYKAEDKLEALKEISFEDVEAAANNWDSEGYVQGFLYGNLDNEQARHLVDTYQRYLDPVPYPKNEHQKKKIFSLKDSSKPTVISKQTSLRGNTSILMIEGPHFSFHNRAAQQIFNGVFKQPFFDTLRTKQQTAYMLHSWGDEKERTLQNFFMAYSNTHDARDILSRFELFIEEKLQSIHNKESEESFNAVKAALIKDMETPPQNMEDMFLALKIFAFEYEDFLWLDKRLAALRQVQFPDWVEITLSTLGKKNSKRLAILNNSLNPDSYQLKYWPLEGKIRDQGIYKSKQEIALN